MAAREDVWIGLGANVGDARATLQAAVAALQALPDTELTGVSRLYRTRPVGPVAQPDFHNAAVSLRAPAGPDPVSGAMALLVALKGLERALGRVEREHWGPRELDLDLLLFGDHRLHVERSAAARSIDPSRSGVQWLDVPHPEAHRRAFVLAPLADLAPDLRPPGWGASVSEALGSVLAIEEGSPTGAAGVVQAVGTWDAGTGAWRDVEP